MGGHLADEPAGDAALCLQRWRPEWGKYDRDCHPGRAADRRARRDAHREKPVSGTIALTPKSQECNCGQGKEWQQGPGPPRDMPVLGHSLGNGLPKDLPKGSSYDENEHRTQNTQKSAHGTLLFYSINPFVKRYGSGFDDGWSTSLHESAVFSGILETGLPHSFLRLITIVNF